MRRVPRCDAGGSCSRLCLAGWTWDLEGWLSTWWPSSECDTTWKSPQDGLSVPVPMVFVEGLGHGTVMCYSAWVSAPPCTLTPAVNAWHVHTLRSTDTVRLAPRSPCSLPELGIKPDAAPSAPGKPDNNVGVAFCDA